MLHVTSISDFLIVISPDGPPFLPRMFVRVRFGLTLELDSRSWPGFG